MLEKKSAPTSLGASVENSSVLLCMMFGAGDLPRFCRENGMKIYRVIRDITLNDIIDESSQRKVMKAEARVVDTHR